MSLQRVLSELKRFSLISQLTKHSMNVSLQITALFISKLIQTHLWITEMKMNDLTQIRVKRI